MAERRCDGCVFWGRLQGPQPADGVVLGECHHSTANADTEGFTRQDRWWCEHFWPADVPLPEPWRPETRAAGPSELLGEIDRLQRDNRGLKQQVDVSHQMLTELRSKVTRLEQARAEHDDPDDETPTP